MKKKAIISINSTQRYDGCEDDAISLITKGNFYKKDKKYYVMYDESELIGIKNTKTTLKVDKETITLIRTGASPTQMIFKENEHHVGLYHTAYGAYTVGIKTKKVENSINENGGSLKLDYDIDLNYEVTGSNTFSITIETDGE